MKLLATFSNAGEAGFVQSLLADAGITADLQDGTLDIGGVPTARLRVADEDFERASEILKAHRATSVSAGEKKKDEHPNARFPFLGIMGITALVWCVLWLTYVLTQMPRSELMKDGLFRAVMGFLAVASSGLLWGLLIGFAVAVVCLIANVTWRKLRNA